MKNKKLLYVIIALLLIWNIALTFFAVKDYRSIIEKTNVVEHDISGFSTDLTRVTEKTKSSVVTVKTNDNVLSGFIYEKKDGLIYVVTCFHGVNLEENIKVIFDSGLSVDAKEIGHDIYSDIAVLEIESDLEVTKVSAGDNTLLSAGEFLISIGTPKNVEYANSSELCIVSSPLRTISNSITYADTIYDYYIDLIQFSGNISSGFSGAPVFNMNGDAVGIVSSNDDDSFFALTMNEAKIVINRIINNEEINKIHLGVSGKYLTDLESYERNNYNLDLSITNGYYITSINYASFASSIGLKTGDVILNINGIDIVNQNNLLEVVYSKPEALTINVYRDGEEISITGNISYD